jgi:hypothetical protein
MPHLRICHINTTYEWETDEPKRDHAIIFFPDKRVANQIERFEKKMEKSCLSFFHGDVKLNESNTFPECNIPAGAILTVRDAKRKREDSPQKKMKMAFSIRFVTVLNKTFLNNGIFVLYFPTEFLVFDDC